jgi:hypothetical protein
MALPSLASAAVGNTGNENVWNVEGIYSTPQGGFFIFESSGFAANQGDVNVYLKDGLTVTLLGSFTVDPKTGALLPNDSPMSDRTSVLIPLTANPNPGAELQFAYVGQEADPAVFLEDFAVTATPYQLIYQEGEDNIPYVDVTGTNDWGPERTIWVKLDYAAEALEDTLETDGTGFLSGTIYLPMGLTGTHTLTLLSPATSNYGAISVTFSVTFN